METPSIVTALKWFATVSGIVAALAIAWDHSRRVTGWGFIIFVGSSLAWIASALLLGDGALGTQNAVLFVINLFGVYRYMIRQRGDG